MRQGLQPHEPRAAIPRDTGCTHPHVRCRYGGVDPLRALLSAEERWRLLNRLDVDSSQPGRPSAQPAVHFYKRRVSQPPVWRLGTARRVCGDTNLTAAHGGEEAGGGGGPGGLSHRPTRGDRALGRLPRPATYLAQSLDCAVRLARGLAASRASARGGAGGGASGGGARPGVWRLHVASDAPGLTAMLERLPGLEGQVVGCLHPHCYEHDNAGAQHSQRAKSRSNDSLQVSGAMGDAPCVGLQPITNEVTAYATYGCSLKCVGLQPRTWDCRWRSICGSTAWLITWRCRLNVPSLAPQLAALAA